MTSVPPQLPERMAGEELSEILKLHKMWLDDDEGGSRANLIGANLEGANLQGARLQNVNLEGAKLVRKMLLPSACCHSVYMVSMFQSIR